MDFEINKKNILLTGATKGLGFEILNYYVSKGYNLILISKNKKKLLNLKKKYKKIINLNIFAVDLAKVERLNNTIKKIIKKFKKIDILINNAGVWGPIGNFDKNNWKKWLEALNINLISSSYLIKSVLPIMKKNNFGRIVQLSGGGATSPMPNFSSYAVSKTAVVRLVETISEECRSFNININAVAPGPMNTNMLNIALKSGKEKVGEYHYNKLLQQKRKGGVGFYRTLSLIDFLIRNRKVSGKLISAIWDPWNKINFKKKIKNKDIYTLRRKLI
jgi:3-oxoacyl-[acyl-carrier protein] reductase